jgi:hypothetical protein
MPNDRIGFGIPNFHKAYDDLLQQRALRNVSGILGDNRIKVYPNPFRNSFSILIKPGITGTTVFSLYDFNGRLYVTKEISVKEGQPQIVNFDKLQPLARGMYILNYSNGSDKGNVTLLAQ